jgi:type III secretion system YscJ/HrcJ family lipoprotein
MKKKTLKFISAVLFAGLLAAACGKVPLYQDLSEEDTNEILVLLSENGIKAAKEKEVRQNEVFWKVIVGNRDLNKARSLLMQHNLPRRRELGLTGVYKEKGLIPTPDEQKARYILAMKGEIINSLERIPSVVDADVVLNIPSKDEFASAEEKAQMRPTASVIVKLKPPEPGEQPLTEAKFQQFVANSVEGLNPRDVAVILTYIPSAGTTLRPGEVRTLLPRTGEVQVPPAAEMEKEIVGLRMDEASKERLKIYLLVFFLLLIVLSGGLVISIVQGSRMRRKLAEMRTGGPGNYPSIEGQVVEKGPPRLKEGKPPETL